MSNLKNYLFTSESVSEGHPDKVSDRISDRLENSYIIFVRNFEKNIACDS